MSLPEQKHSYLKVGWKAITGAQFYEVTCEWCGDKRLSLAKRNRNLSTYLFHQTTSTNAEVDVEEWKQAGYLEPGNRVAVRIRPCVKFGHQGALSDEAVLVIGENVCSTSNSISTIMPAVNVAVDSEGQKEREKEHGGGSDRATSPPASANNDTEGAASSDSDFEEDTDSEEEKPEWAMNEPTNESTNESMSVANLPPGTRRMLMAEARSRLEEPLLLQFGLDWAEAEVVLARMHSTTELALAIRDPALVHAMSRNKRDGIFAEMKNHPVGVATAPVVKAGEKGNGFVGKMRSTVSNQHEEVEREEQQRIVVPGEGSWFEREHWEGEGHQTAMKGGRKAARRRRKTCRKGRTARGTEPAPFKEKMPPTRRRRRRKKASQQEGGLEVAKAEGQEGAAKKVGILALVEEQELQEVKSPAEQLQDQRKREGDLVKARWEAAKESAECEERRTRHDLERRRTAWAEQRERLKHREAERWAKPVLARQAKEEERRRGEIEGGMRWTADKMDKLAEPCTRQVQATKDLQQRLEEEQRNKPRGRWNPCRWNPCGTCPGGATGGGAKGWEIVASSSDMIENIVTAPKAGQAGQGGTRFRDRIGSYYASQSGVIPENQVRALGRAAMNPPVGPQLGKGWHGGVGVASEIWNRVPLAADMISMTPTERKARLESSKKEEVKRSNKAHTEKLAEINPRQLRILHEHQRKMGKRCASRLCPGGDKAKGQQWECDPHECGGCRGSGYYTEQKGCTRWADTGLSCCPFCDTHRKAVRSLHDKGWGAGGPAGWEEVAPSADMITAGDTSDSGTGGRRKIHDKDWTNGGNGSEWEKIMPSSDMLVAPL
jgi:hypothetical protein